MRRYFPVRVEYLQYLLARRRCNMTGCLGLQRLDLVGLPIGTVVRYVCWRLVLHVLIVILVLGYPGWRRSFVVKKGLTSLSF